MRYPRQVYNKQFVMVYYIDFPIRTRGFPIGVLFFGDLTAIDPTW